MVVRSDIEREKARASDSRLLQGFALGALKPPCAMYGTLRRRSCQAGGGLGVFSVS